MPSITSFEIEHRPAYAMLKLNLKAQETLVVEAGAMAAMDPCITLKSRVKGGVMKGIGRMFAGESLFLSEFTAQGKPGQLFLSPGVPGDIQHYSLAQNDLLIQSSGFVACSPSVVLDTQFQGMKGFFSGESLFLVKASGVGDIWFSSFGAILEIPVDGDYVVDTGYVAAFESSLQYSVELLGGLSFKGLKTGIFGGEGLVCRFRGRGKLWIQSRNLLHFINFIAPFRPTSNS